MGKALQIRAVRRKRVGIVPLHAGPHRCGDGLDRMCGAAGDGQNPGELRGLLDG
jgi:hypothetical protein